jgi:hypothetical protein
MEAFASCAATVLLIGLVDLRGKGSTPGSKAAAASFRTAGDDICLYKYCTPYPMKSSTILYVKSGTIPMGKRWHSYCSEQPHAGTSRHVNPRSAFACQDEGRYCSQRRISAVAAWVSSCGGWRGWVDTNDPLCQRPSAVNHRVAWWDFLKRWPSRYEREVLYLRTASSATFANRTRCPPGRRP